MLIEANLHVYIGKQTSKLTRVGYTSEPGNDPGPGMVPNAPKGGSGFMFALLVILI